jgi:hypothetical protein
MNPGLQSLTGKALHYAKRSMEPQFEHVDRGEDQLLNRIIWYAMKGKERFPRELTGEEEDDEDEEEESLEYEYKVELED